MSWSLRSKENPSTECICCLYDSGLYFGMRHIKLLKFVCEIVCEIKLNCEFFSLFNLAYDHIHQDLKFEKRLWPKFILTLILRFEFIIL